MLHLVDSNVILDIITDDANWCEWSIDTLEAHEDNLAINPIIYSEISIGFNHIDHVEEHIKIFKKLPLPFEAGFLAGKAFLAYKKNKGTREKHLPDFFIGAHAAALNIPLITRDIARYTTYFPTVKLIHP